MDDLFLKGNDDTPELYMYMTIVDSVTPLLFVCRSVFNTLYICSHPILNGLESIWVIVETSPEQIIKLLDNVITMRDIFIQEETGYIITKRRGLENPIIEKTKTIDIPDHMLPTAKYKLEAETDEFNEEIQKLYNYKEITDGNEI